MISFIQKGEKQRKSDLHLRLFKCRTIMMAPTMRSNPTTAATTSGTTGMCGGEGGDAGAGAFICLIRKNK